VRRAFVSGRAGSGKTRPVVATGKTMEIFSTGKENLAAEPATSLFLDSVHKIATETFFDKPRLGPFVLELKVTFPSEPRAIP
jgi:hypothetical protein